MDDRRILVDTSVIIDHFRKKDKNKSALYKIPSGYKRFISVITVFELNIGTTSQESQRYWQDMINYFEVIDLNLEVVNTAADIFKNLRSQNKLIDFKDLIIAATAIFHNLPLSTLNKKHFERVDTLKFL
jgi:tRNA(fMet)-specific endonuclease VapC